MSARLCSAPLFEEALRVPLGFLFPFVTLRDFSVTSLLPFHVLVFGEYKTLELFSQTPFYAFL